MLMLVLMPTVDKVDTKRFFSRSLELELERIKVKRLLNASTRALFLRTKNIVSSKAVEIRGSRIRAFEDSIEGGLSAILLTFGTLPSARFSQPSDAKTFNFYAAIVAIARHRNLYTTER